MVFFSISYLSYMCSDLRLAGRNVPILKLCFVIFISRNGITKAEMRRNKRTEHQYREQNEKIKTFVQHNDSIQLFPKMHTTKCSIFDRAFEISINIVKRCVSRQFESNQATENTVSAKFQSK